MDAVTSIERAEGLRESTVTAAPGGAAEAVEASRVAAVEAWERRSAAHDVAFGEGPTPFCGFLDRRSATRASASCKLAYEAHEAHDARELAEAEADLDLELAEQSAGLADRNHRCRAAAMASSWTTTVRVGR